MNIGKLYEEKAIKYLIKKNFTILKTNARLNKSEVDIVCEKDNKIYAIEVKYRKNINFINIKKSQLSRIEHFMLNNFPGVFFKTIILIYTNNSFKIMDII